MLHANDAKARLAEDHSKVNIAIAENDIDFDNAIAGDDFFNNENASNIQLESLLSEIDDYGEEFWHYGKSFHALDYHACESDHVSNNDVNFTKDATKSNA